MILYLNVLMMIFSVSTIAAPNTIAPQARPLQQQMIIYRPAQEHSVTSLYYRIFVNNQAWGKLKYNRPLHHPITAGTYRLVANDKHRSSITVEKYPQHPLIVRASINKHANYKIQFETVDVATFKQEAPALWKQIKNKK